MVPRARLSAIAITTPLPDVLRAVIASPYSRLPVYRRHVDNIVGILHTKDLVTEYVEGRRALSLAPLVRPIARVQHDMPADRLIAFLRERRTHQALVLDASGRVAGFITLEDVVAELLGDVTDEFKMARLRSARTAAGEDG
jgi:CBS domain containing-hemolysin-like protein